MKIEVGKRYLDEKERVGFCFAKKGDGFLFVFSGDKKTVYFISKNGISPYSGLKIKERMDD